MYYLVASPDKTIFDYPLIHIVDLYENGFGYPLHEPLYRYTPIFYFCIVDYNEGEVIVAMLNGCKCWALPANVLDNTDIKYNTYLLFKNIPDAIKDSAMMLIDEHMV